MESNFDCIVKARSLYLRWVLAMAQIVFSFILVGRLVDWFPCLRAVVQAGGSHWLYTVGDTVCVGGCVGSDQSNLRVAGPRLYGDGWEFWTGETWQPDPHLKLFKWNQLDCLPTVCKAQDYIICFIFILFTPPSALITHQDRVLLRSDNPAAEPGDGGHLPPGQLHRVPQDGGRLPQRPPCLLIRQGGSRLRCLPESQQDLGNR